MKRNEQGYRIGEEHHMAKHADSVVEAARQMRDQGAAYREIADRLGVSLWTARDWCDYRTR